MTNYTNGYRSAISQIVKDGSSKEIAFEHFEIRLPYGDFATGWKKACFDFVELLERVNTVSDCTYCDGMGEIECDLCGGDLDIECDECGGDGCVGEGCENCDNEGVTECPECCGNGTETCSECNGSGVEYDDE